MTDHIEHTAQAIAQSFKAQRGYSALTPMGYALVFVPTPMVDGLDFPTGIIVTEVGYGSAIIENPKRLNKFVFAKSGFTLPTGDFAARVIKRFVVLIEASVARAEPGHSTQFLEMERADG